MEILKDLRKLKGITQNDVALSLGISRATYTRYEIGDRQPDNAMLAKLAKYFDVSTDYLLGLTDTTPSPQDEPITSPQEKELLGLIAQLTYEEKKVIDEQIQFMISRRK